MALWLYCSIKGPFGVWIVLKSNINSGPILRVNTSFLPRLETGIMSGTGLIQVKIQEKVDACFPTLSGKKGTVLKLSLTVFDNSKSPSSFRFH